VFVSTTRPGSSGAILAAKRTDDVAARLQRFVHMDDDSSAVGCSRVEDDSRKLNASLLADYERRVKASPTEWGISLTDILFSDCLAHFGKLAVGKDNRYADTQLSILNRLHAFHATPGISSSSATTAVSEPLIQEVQQQEATVLLPVLEQVSRKALQAHVLAGQGSAADDIDDDDKQDDDDDRRYVDFV